MPTRHELDLFEIAVSTLELTGDDSISWLNIGAQKFLGEGIWRREPIGVRSVCPPDDIYGRAAKSITDHQGLSRGRITEYGLNLASKLPEPNPYIVEVVANSAFNPTPQESEIFTLRDMRPFARTVLASFGREAAAQYGDVAYREMSSNNSLGTGAAQVAAAAGHSHALPRIEDMMDALLSSVPTNKAVPLETGKRLYELSYAIYFGGEEGKLHAGPIKELMTRNVESAAPPFGILELRPVEMCEVLKRIEGQNSAKAYDFCANPKTRSTARFDQRFILSARYSQLLRAVRRTSA